MNLYSGPFAILYEDGFLRQIKYGDNEILRMIYYAFRDENWGTLEKTIENQLIETEGNSFSINYDSYHIQNGRRVFQWKVSITGDDHGRINFEISGTALADIMKNRVGFCVLHPLQNTKGASVGIYNEKGKKYPSAFPEYIAPQCPFIDIHRMKWNHLGNWYELHFEGDVFETEDQRNWGDSSYKTYCTPLSNPFPVQLQKNSTIYQKVVFQPSGKLPAIGGISDKPIELTVTGRPFKLPYMGTAIHTSLMPDKECGKLIGQLGLHHLRIDVEPSSDNWQGQLSEAGRLATETGTGLEAVIHVEHGDLEELKLVLKAIHESSIPVYSILALDKGSLVTLQKTIDFLSKVKKEFPGIKFGAGTDYNFTEINRYRFEPKDIDFISFSIHPQEHAFDNLTLIENIEAQGDAVETLRHIYGSGYEVHLSPVTLRKRFNPYATNPEKMVLSEQEKADPRQSEPFCAVWTLGSLKQLVAAGADSIIFHQSLGPQGIIGSHGQPWPVYHALKLFLSCAVSPILPCRSGAPLVADGIWFDSGKGIIWNYTGEPVRVALQNRVEELGSWEFREAIL